MKDRLKSVLWSLLATALIFGFALAVPLGSIKEEAQFAYLNEAPTDDEYAFLFGE